MAPGRANGLCVVVVGLCSSRRIVVGEEHRLTVHEVGRATYREVSEIDYVLSGQGVAAGLMGTEHEAECRPRVGLRGVTGYGVTAPREAMVLRCYGVTASETIPH